jgi:hypothetical protein
LPNSPEYAYPHGDVRAVKIIVARVSRSEKILDESGRKLSHVNAFVKKISCEYASFKHLTCA